MTGTNQGDAASWFDRQRNRIEQQRRDILGEISGERARFRLTPERAVEDRFELLRRTGYQLLQTTNASNDPLSRSFEALYSQLTTLSTSLRGGGGARRRHAEAAAAGCGASAGTGAQRHDGSVAGRRQPNDPAEPEEPEQRGFIAGFRAVQGQHQRALSVLAQRQSGGRHRGLLAHVWAERCHAAVLR